MSITNTPYSVAPYPASVSTYTTVGSNFYTVPATAGGSPVSGVYVYLLGCGGMMGHNPGGGGGFVSGFYSCNPGTNFIYVVGGSGATLAQGGGGGTNGLDSTKAGGFTGLFLSNAGAIAQSNAIAIAGGGGCGGYFGVGNGGGGGYPTGSAGTQGSGYGGTVSGGTQTAGGTGGGAGAIGGNGIVIISYVFT